MRCVSAGPLKVALDDKDLRRKSMVAMDKPIKSMHSPTSMRAQLVTIRRHFPFFSLMHGNGRSCIVVFNGRDSYVARPCLKS